MRCKNSDFSDTFIQIIWKTSCPRDKRLYLRHISARPCVTRRLAPCLIVFTGTCVWNDINILFKLVICCENLWKSLDLKATKYLYIDNWITESRSSCSCARRVWRRRRMTVCPAPCRDTGACTWFCRSCPPCTPSLQHVDTLLEWRLRTEDPLWCLVPFAFALDPHQAPAVHNELVCQSSVIYKRS